MEAAGVDVVLAQHVVEHEAAAGHQRAAAFPIRHGNRRCVAAAIHHAHMGGAAQGLGFLLPVCLKLGAARQERVRVAMAFSAQRVHPQQGGGDVRGRYAPAPVGGFEPVEAQRHHDPAGGGGRHGLDPQVTHACYQRRAGGDLVEAQIIQGEVAAPIIRLPCHGLGDLALGGQHLALADQGIKRISEGRVLLHSAFRQQPALRVGEQRAQGRACGEDRFDDSEEIGLERCDPDALPGGADGGLGDARHRHAAEALMHPEQAGQEAGRCRGTEADMEGLGDAAEIHVHFAEVDVAAGAFAARGLGEKVEDAGGVTAPGITFAGGHEAAAARGGQDGLGHAGGKHTGDGSIKRIAAILQKLESRRRGDLMARGDGSLVRHDLSVA